MPRTHHLPALDGLRALAVLLVLWCHVPMGLPGYPGWLAIAHTVIGPGGLGVDIFFVLSGFLITRILLDERARGVPLRWFLLRRCLRIFPIYYLLLAWMAVVEPHEGLAYGAIYLSNLYLIHHPELIWSMAHTWSLSIEEHWYLLWPMVVALAPTRWHRPVLWFLVFPLAWLCAVWLATTPPPHALLVVQHASPVRFFSLGLGSLVACHETWLAATRWRQPALATLLAIVGIALHPVLVFALIPYWTGQALLDPAREPLVWLGHSAATSTAILLFTIALGERRWSPLRFLCWAPLRGIGRISYGLYLYHLPIFHWLLVHTPTLGNLALAVGLSFAVAITSYLVLERPILRFAARFRGA